MLLARHHLDHGRPLAAAMLLKTLDDAPGRDDALIAQTTSLGALAFYRAGRSDQAVQFLTKAVAAGRTKTTIGKKPLPLNGDVAGLTQWLRDAAGPIPSASLAAAGEWAMFRGNPARNASMSGGSPLLNPRWSSFVSPNRQTELTSHTYRSNLLNQGLPAIPALQALAVGEYIVYRTPSAIRPIQALNFENGKESWSYGSGEAPGVSPNDTVGSQKLNLRNWTNLNYGGLSSDGKNVYFVEDDAAVSDQASGSRLSIQQRRWGGPFGGESGYVVPQTPNHIYALELATQGKMQWVVGGKSNEQDPRLSGATFLGAPLPLNGSLYVLAEIKQAISLVVLDAATGKLQWSQELLLLDEQNQAELSSWRRIVGASPTYSEGLLLCPTATGDLVAVDLVQRTLAWTHRSKQGNRGNENIHNNPFYIMMVGGGAGIVPGSMWSEAVAVAAEGAVLYTSPEADRLYCLDLSNGTVRWEIPRKQNLYVGGITGDRVVLIGKREVQCLSLKDKRSLWTSTLALPTGCVTSGRGFLSGDDYYLPVGSGDVLRIDLAAGTIKSRAHSAGGTIPGNLLCYRGNVVSMGIDRIEKYAQSELLKTQVESTLAKTPHDWQALGWRGEIALDEGRFGDALTALRAAKESALAGAGLPQNAEKSSLIESQIRRINGLLFKTLHATVQADFASHQAELNELEGLIGDDHERSIWLRLAAEGSERTGRYSAALGYSLDLSELDLDQDRMERIDSYHEVDRDAWIQTRLQALWAKVPAAERAAWNKKLQARLDLMIQADVTTQSRAMRRYIALFGFHPTADAVREALIKSLGGEDPLRSETLLLTLSKSEDAVRRRRAAARLASLYQAADREDAAAVAYRTLRDRYGDDECLEGLTGKQWAASVPADSRLGKRIASGDVWPTGLIEETRPTNRRDRRMPGVNQQMWSVMEIRGVSGGPLESHQLLYDQNSSMLSLRDGQGREIRKISLQKDNSLQFGIYVPGAYALAQDHLLVIDLGWRIVAFNLLESGRSHNAAQVLGSWNYDLVDYNFLLSQSQIGAGVLTFQEKRDETGWGLRRRQLINQGTKQPFGAIAFCGRTGLAVYRQREVTLLDPLTGEPIWVRRNLPEDCELTGDADNLALLTKDGRKSLILRAGDGSLVTERDLPERRRIVAKSGMRLLTSETKVGKRTLIARNLVDDSQIALGEYGEGGTRGGVAADLLDDELAIVTPGPKTDTARFEIVSLSDGSKRFTTIVQAQGPIRNVDVRRDATGYYVAIDNGGPVKADGKYNYQLAVQDGSERQLFTGELHAFDRTTGAALWPAGATFQQHSIWKAQPAELPCLVFLRMGVPKNGGNQFVSMLCLDKKTGRLVYKKDDQPGQPQNFDVLGDWEAGQVRLMVPSQTGDGRNAIVLEYTDRPRSPEPPFQETLTTASDAKSASRGIGGLFGGLRRAVEGSSRRRSEANPFDEAPDIEMKIESAEDQADVEAVPDSPLADPALVPLPPPAQPVPRILPAPGNDPFAPFGK
ncbi:MAG: PQQ-binding-like beta-propeller repeat protein [Pirellulales bacterium]